MKCENPKCMNDASDKVRGHDVCSNHKRWAEGQPLVKMTKLPKHNRYTGKNRNWSDYYSKHPEAD